MLEEVLNTEVKVKIMKFFAKYPENQFQALEVAKSLGFSVSRTSECLKDLADKGVLASRKISKGYLFKVNKSNYLTKIILDAFRKEREFVNLIAKDFVLRIKRLDKIKSIVLFGSALKELKIGSDVDFLIVSTHAIDRSAVSEICADLTAKYGFPISSLLMTVDELRRKAKGGENFVIEVIANGKVVFGKCLEDLIW